MDLVFVAFLIVPFPFPDRDEQLHFLVKRNCTRLLYVSQSSLQPMDHNFKQLHADIASNSLSDILKRGCDFINW